MDRFVTLRELAGTKDELKDWMLGHFVTKKEFSDFRDETLTRFDSLFGSFEDLKQEQLFTNHALRRIESKLGI